MCLISVHFQPSFFCSFCPDVRAFAHPLKDEPMAKKSLPRWHSMVYQYLIILLSFHGPITFEQVPQITCLKMQITLEILERGKCLVRREKKDKEGICDGDVFRSFQELNRNKTKYMKS